MLLLEGDCWKIFRRNYRYLFICYYLSIIFTLLESLHSLNIRSSIEMNTKRNSFINVDSKCVR
jgi:hypothetical protein